MRLLADSVRLLLLRACSSRVARSWRRVSEGRGAGATKEAGVTDAKQAERSRLVATLTYEPDSGMLLTPSL